MKELRDFIEKAEKFLTTAQHALKIGDYDSCVSRCYYAMFLMAEAVLLTKGLSASSHKGVISLFGEHFIKTEVFEKDFGKTLNDAYDERLVGDYEIGFKITKEVAKELLEKAQNFVQKLKNYLIGRIGAPEEK
ncbi:MAG: HEPN domain-containing protein [candidate division WOR-3 bacterium]|nr:HEPN domain-containing protein [candidate division WOR-3 bacterium]MDH5684350.1 HEPN domain-containing protein [candidate division WOR-3 bacterium]